MTNRAFTLRFSMAYAFMMLGSGVQLPFLPLWLHAKGIDVSGIAFIVAGMMAVRVIGAPLFSWLADHFGHRVMLIRLCALGAFIAYAALALQDGFWPIAMAALLAGFFFAPVFPLSEGYSVDASAALGLDYGRMRLWASVSFLAGSLVSGALLTKLDPLDAAWLLAAAQGLAVLSALLLPDEPQVLKTFVRSAGISVGKVLFRSGFAIFVLAAGLAQASHGALYSVSSLHWQMLGYDTLAIGVFWTAAVTAEVALLVFSHKLLTRFGPGILFLAGISGGVVRWLGMAFATSAPLIMGLQMLHAASFALTHLGTMYMIRLLVPEQVRNRAQGLYSAVSGGIFLASMSWLSGDLFAGLGANVYLVMAFVSAASLVCAVMLFRLNPTVRALAAA